jgi:hypothetical protein
MNLKNDNKYKFNLYCNYLMAFVEDGYIIFLDDDDMLTHDNVLSILNDTINTYDDFVIWKFFRPDKLIYPVDINNIKLGEIASCSFCFHSKYKHSSVWNDMQYGDYYFINNLLKNNKFNIKMSEYILTNTIFTDRIGNFGIANIC